MNNIQMIDINRLHPHPDNPRKDVGDVTELADSIRHSGVMQNLTVVPYAGDYRVIIGHRRLAAAKEVGLTELPCRVVEMTEREQVATMIAENMQRADLTVPEQVHGIQMMLDLGESLEDVQKKTGLSRSTVYHRKAMAALPADELQKSWERGGTIADYVALEGIEDLKIRAALLHQIGTNNFSYALQNAKEEQKYQKKLEEVLVLLEPVAKRLEHDREGIVWRTVRFYKKSWREDLKQAVAAMEADDEEPFYFHIGENSWNRDRAFIYRGEAPKNTGKNKYDAALDRQRTERRIALEKLHNTIREHRSAFIKNNYVDRDSPRMMIATEFLIVGRNIYSWDRAALMMNVFGVKGDAETAFLKMAAEQPGKLMLASLVESEPQVKDYEGRYQENPAANRIRELLGSLGYVESDEEKAYWTGTHKLFLKEEQADV